MKCLGGTRKWWFLWFLIESLLVEMRQVRREHPRYYYSGSEAVGVGYLIYQFVHMLLSGVPLVT